MCSSPLFLNLKNKLSSLSSAAREFSVTFVFAFSTALFGVDQSGSRASALKSFCEVEQYSQEEASQSCQDQRPTLSLSHISCDQMSSHTISRRCVLQLCDSEFRLPRHSVWAVWYRPQQVWSPSSSPSFLLSPLPHRLHTVCTEVHNDCHQTGLNMHPHWSHIIDRCKL